MPSASRLWNLAPLTFALCCLAGSFSCLPAQDAQPVAAAQARSRGLLALPRNAAVVTVPIRHEQEEALDRQWLLKMGDDPHWAEDKLDDADWQVVQANRSWAEQGHFAVVGYGWYRIHLRLEPSDGNDPPAVLIPHLDDVFEVYWKGRPLGGSGQFPPRPLWYQDNERPGIYDLPVQGTAPVEGVLALRVWKAPLSTEDDGKSGGFSAAPVAGTEDDLQRERMLEDYRWLRGNLILFAVDLLYAVVGLICLTVWLRRRERLILLWTGVFAIAPAIRAVLFQFRFHFTVNRSYAVAPLFSCLRDISLWFLLIWLLKMQSSRRIRRLVRLAAAASVGAMLLDTLVPLEVGALPWTLPLQIADVLLTGIYCLTAFVPLILIGYAVRYRRGLGLARWVLAIAAFAWGMLQVLLYTAAQGSRFTHWTLAKTLRAPMFHIAGSAVTLSVVASFFLLVAVVYAVYRDSIERRERQNRLEQEVKSAHELQTVLIPAELPPVEGYAITSFYKPAREVGGDFFQILPMKSGSTLLVLGDVSGKGMRAAMEVALIVGLLTVLARETESPRQILNELNRNLLGRLRGGFTTCLAMLVRPDGNCTLANAGHPSPFLNGNELPEAGTMPLGIDDRESYHERSLQLAVGDHLALYTDGVTEARSETGEMYGFQRLNVLFAGRPDARAATEAAIEFGQEDDITVLTLQRVRVGDESAAHSL